MLQTITTGITKFPEIRISVGEIHQARGFFGNRYKERDILHNHDPQTGKPIYRYPAVQFKRDTDGSLAIYAYGQEGIAILEDIFLSVENITINNKTFPVRGKEIEISEIQFGEDGETYAYRFLTPWIALNSENYQDYCSLADDNAKKLKLHAILVNNIISFCKFAGYTIQNRLSVKSRFQETGTILKGKNHIAFTGEWMINFLLPDFLGLGKSPSRGFGCIEKML